MEKSGNGILDRIRRLLTPPCLRARESRRSVEHALLDHEQKFALEYARRESERSARLDQAIQKGHVILCPEQYYELVISWSRGRSSDVIKAMLKNLGIPMLKEGLCVSDIGYQNFDLIIKLYDAKFSDEYEDQIADELGAPIIDSRTMGSSKKWHRGRPEFAHLTLVEASSDIQYCTERVERVQGELNEAYAALESGKNRYEEALKLIMENLPSS